MNETRVSSELIAFCDGSGTVHTEPAFIGVVVYRAKGMEALCEVSEYIEWGTNNVAELRALRRALWLLEQLDGPHAKAIVYSDSQYALGMTRNTILDVRTNHRLVRALRKQYAKLPHVQLLHCRGHAGVYGNNVADWLAHRARVHHMNGIRHEAMKPRNRPLFRGRWWPSQEQRAS